MLGLLTVFTSVWLQIYPGPLSYYVLHQKVLLSTKPIKMLFLIRNRKFSSDILSHYCHTLRFEAPWILYCQSPWSRYWYFCYIQCVFSSPCFCITSSWDLVRFYFHWKTSYPPQFIRYYSSTFLYPVLLFTHRIQKLYFISVKWIEPAPSYVLLIHGSSLTIRSTINN